MRQLPQIEVDTLHADIRGEYSDVDAPSSLVVILEALSSMYGWRNLFSSYARLETVAIKDSSVSVFSKCRHDCAPKWANEMTWRAVRARLVEKLKASKDSVGNGPIVWILPFKNFSHKKSTCFNHIFEFGTRQKF